MYSWDLGFPSLGFWLSIIILICIFIISFGSFFLVIIALWKIFKKANISKWNAIIPIYNIICLCNMVGVSPYWLLILIILSFVSVASAFITNVFVALLIYFMVILCLSIAKSFGKDTSFGILTFFFMPICLMILGFGKSEYVGVCPVKDVILNLFIPRDEKQNQVKRKEATKSATKKSNEFCKECGE